MSSVFENKIRFQLEPIKKFSYDDESNPAFKKNKKLYKIFQLLKLKIILLSISIPILLFLTFHFKPIGYSIIPICILNSLYILKLKIKFQLVTKKITLYIVDLKPGELVVRNFKKNLSYFMILKKSMGLYYMKKINLEDYVKNNNFSELDKIKKIDYNQQLIIKAMTLHENYLKVIPISGFHISPLIDNALDKAG